MFYYIVQSSAFYIFIYIKTKITIFTHDSIKGTGGYSTTQVVLRVRLCPTSDSVYKQEMFKSQLFRHRETIRIRQRTKHLMIKYLVNCTWYFFLEDNFVKVTKTAIVVRVCTKSLYVFM